MIKLNYGTNQNKSMNIEETQKLDTDPSLVLTNNLSWTNGFEAVGPLGSSKILYWECAGVGDPMSKDFKWGLKRYLFNYPDQRPSR